MKSEKVRVTAEWREADTALAGLPRKEIASTTIRSQRNREIKHVAKSALLQVLTKVTGRAQPWGILTGVRPTKLFHSMLLKGYPLEQVQETYFKNTFFSQRKWIYLTEIVHRQRSVLPDFISWTAK